MYSELILKQFMCLTNTGPIRNLANCGHVRIIPESRCKHVWIDRQDRNIDKSVILNKEIQQSRPFRAGYLSTATYTIDLDGLKPFEPLHLRAMNLMGDGTDHLGDSA